MNLANLFQMLSNRMETFAFDGMMNDVSSIIGVKLKGEKEEQETTAETLHPYDRFFVYRNYLNRGLGKLYEKYIPSQHHHYFCPTDTPEISAYTLFLCGLWEVDTETFLESYFTEHSLNDLDFALLDDLPASLRPSDKKEQAVLLLKLFNFPPLLELWKFYTCGFSLYSRTLETFASMVVGEDFRFEMPFPRPKTLHFSAHPLPGNFFHEHPVDSLLAHPELVNFKEDLLEIKEKSMSSSCVLDSPCHCKECGTIQDTVEIPPEGHQYILLMKKPELMRRLGLVFYEESEAYFCESWRSGLEQVFEELNQVAAPKCIILVEGESEEYALPHLALRMGKLLREKEILVFNAQSKQKLKNRFIEFKKVFPKQKIVMLLDSDAVKERDDINRMIKGKKDKYHLEFIEKGAFEDLFSLDVCVEVLNKLHPEKEEIVVSDFDDSKCRVKELSRVLHQKKNAKLDKVKFSRGLVEIATPETIPESLKRVINKAHDLVSVSNSYEIIDND